MDHKSSKRLTLLAKVMLVGITILLLALFGVNASKPGKIIEGCYDACGEPAVRQAGPMRIVSLNMLHGFPQFTDLRIRMGLIRAEIRRLDADVALLQEVPWTIKTGNVAEAIAQELGYPGACLRWIYISG